MMRPSLFRQTMRSSKRLGPLPPWSRRPYLRQGQMSHGIFTVLRKAYPVNSLACVTLTFFRNRIPTTHYAPAYTRGPHCLSPSLHREPGIWTLASGALPRCHPSRPSPATPFTKFAWHPRGNLCISVSEHPVVSVDTSVTTYDQTLCKGRSEDFKAPSS
ncbi:hypothetical protein B0H34DRAFT_267558 [Crassisporium funariophilum]|nr:hypothetical protein B0H34DRAFT_267558 [Crassisporium funariophilum]